MGGGRGNGMAGVVPVSSGVEMEALSALPPQIVIHSA